MTRRVRWRGEGKARFSAKLAASLLAAGSRPANRQIGRQIGSEATAMLPSSTSERLTKIE